MDPSIILNLLIVGFLTIVAAYIVSLLINKRTMDAVQTTAAATLTATQNLIAISVCYGAYERSEILRMVSAIIGVDQARDTALEFQNNRQLPFTVSYYRVANYPELWGLLAQQLPTLLGTMALLCSEKQNYAMRGAK